MRKKTQNKIIEINTNMWEIIIHVYENAYLFKNTTTKPIVYSQNYIIDLYVIYKRQKKLKNMQKWKVNEGKVSDIY